jgi:hypothetical protein
MSALLPEADIDRSTSEVGFASGSRRAKGRAACDLGDGPQIDAALGQARDHRAG